MHYNRFLLIFLIFSISEFVQAQYGVYYCDERHLQLTITKGKFENTDIRENVYSWTLPDGLRHGVRTESERWEWNVTRDTMILYIEYYDSTAYEHVFTATAVINGKDLDIGFYWVRDCIPPKWMQYYKFVKDGKTRKMVF